MTRSPAPLPPELGDAFTYAEAIGNGVTPRRLRHHRLHKPTRGLRLVQPPADLAARAVAHLKVLPAGRCAYSHATAAQLLGLPGGCDHRLHVTLKGGCFVRRPGIVMHHGLERREIWYVAGLPVIAPVLTWLDLAPTSDLEEMVVLGDAILHREPDLAEALHQTVADNCGADPRCAPPRTRCPVADDPSRGCSCGRSCASVGTTAAISARRDDDKCNLVVATALRTATWRPRCDDLSR